MRSDSTAISQQTWLFMGREGSEDGTTHVLNAPKNDHALEKRCAGAACAHKEIKQGASDGCWRFLSQLQAVLCSGNLEELHLAAHIVQGGNEEVHGPVHGMKLRIVRLRQPYLGQQLSHEAYIAAGIMAVLDQPL